jgi:hypothetical protein
MPRGRKPKSHENVWDRVDKAGGPLACWPWTGCRDRRGYGVTIIRGKTWGAHRLALLVHHGYGQNESIVNDPKVFACHACDNPICCNPLHLYFGTAKDNTRDMMIRKRHKGKVTLSDEDRLLLDILARRGCRSGLIAEAVGCSIKHAAEMLKQNLPPIPPLAGG